MEGFLVLLAAVLVAAIVLGPIGFFIALRAADRVRMLRLEVDALRSQLRARPPVSTPEPTPPAPTPSTDPLATPQPPVTPEAPPAPPRPAAPPALPRSGVDLESVIGGQWLTWVGVLAIFFGTAFFLAYDLGESRLAGVGQVLTGVVVGMLFVVVGRMLVGRPAQRILGQGLLGGGVALLYLSAYASFGFHHLVPAGVVYGFLLGVAAVGTAVALFHNSLAVAVLTLIGALLTPILLESDHDPTRLLLPYLIAVNLGMAAVATRRSWPVLPMVGFVGTWFIALWWWDAYYTLDVRPVAAIAFTALWIIYAALPFVGPSRHRLWSLTRAVVVPLNGFAFVWFLYALMEPDLTFLRGPVAAVVALLYVIGARLGRERGAPAAVSMTHYTGIAIAVLAVPIQFDAEATTVGWSLLGLVLVVAGIQQPSTAHRWWGLAVQSMALFRVILFDMSTATGPSPATRPVFNVAFLAATLVIAGFVATIWLYHRHRARLTPTERTFLPALVLTTASAVLWRISSEVIGTFRARDILAGTPGAHRLASLLTLSWIWAVYAGILIAAGFVVRYRPIRLLGVAILGILVIKVFLLDMQELERGYRIASFVGVGVLLLIISLIYQRERRA